MKSILNLIIRHCKTLYEHIMKHLLLFLASLFCISNIWSAPRSESEARKIALQFMESRSKATVRSLQELQLAATSHDIGVSKKRNGDTGKAAWYAYNYGDMAFVIISGDNRMTDILGYSLNNTFSTENMPDNQRMWLQAYTAQAETINSQSAEAQDLTSRTVTTPQEVAPLLGNIRYNQTAPYNGFCPTVGGQQCYTGCVATAMATIMSFYQYPDKGTGSQTYISPSIGRECSFDYDATPFDWNNILPTYSEGEYNQTQADAIATLMKACGVAAMMDYGINSSGASSSEALIGTIEHLKYNPYAIYASREFYTASEWMQMIKTSLAAGEPVYYSGNDQYANGHAFVIDGYDRQDLVHVDWGWGGLNNGYFELLSLNAEQQDGGNGYSFSQSMLYGLKPATYPDCSRTSQFFSNDMEVVNDELIVSQLYNRGYTFSGYLAAAIEQNGTLTPVSNEVEINELPCNYGFSKISFFISQLDQLTAGRYQVYVASRAKDETQWMKANGLQYNNPYYILAVNGDGSHEWYTADGYSLPPTASVTLKTPTYNNLPFRFEVTVSNPKSGEEFYAPVFLTIGTDEQAQSSQNIYCGHVLLQAGQDTTLIGQATLSVENNGKYVFYPTWFDGTTYQILGNPTESEVRKGTATEAYELSECRIDKTSYEANETIICAFTAGIPDGDEADLLSSTLYIYILNEDGYSVYYKAVNLFAEKGQPAEYHLELQNSLSPGHYMLLYRNVNDNLWSTEFSVIDATDVKSVKTASSDIPVYIPTPGEPTIRFKYDGRVSKIDVFSFSGSRLYTTTSPQKSQEGYSLTIPGLYKGNYLLHILTDDHRAYTLKISK